MKYTAENRELIDRAIRNASLANLTEAGTVEYIKDKTGILIGKTQLYERRRSLKIRRIKMWNAYRNDDYAYRLEHLERIDEAKLVRDLAIENIMRYREDERKFFYVQKSAYLLLDANKRIDELTQKIPEIDVIGYSSNGVNDNAMEQKIPELSELSTEQVGNLSQRKF